MVFLQCFCLYLPFTILEKQPLISYIFIISMILLKITAHFEW